MGPHARPRAMMTPCSPRPCRIVLLAFLLITASFPQTREQEDGPLDPSLPEGVTVRDIISRFAGKEEIYKQDREHYTYRQVVRMQTLDDRGSPDGQDDDNLVVTFKDQAERDTKPVVQQRDKPKR